MFLRRPLAGETRAQLSFRGLSATLCARGSTTLQAQKLLPVRKFLEVWSDTFQLQNGRWATREGAASSSAPRQSTL